MEKVSLTVRGWCISGASAISVAVGFALVEGALIAGGITGLVAMLVARGMCRANLRHLSIERRLPDNCFAGDLFHVRYVLQSARGRRVSSAYLEDTLTPGVPGVVADSAGEEGAEAVTQTRIDSRGVVPGADIGVRSDYPLGLFEANRWVSVSSRMIVYPRPLVTRSMVQAQEALEMHAMAHSSPLEGSDQFRAIREFRPGDPVKRIHWPATSRAGGTPMVCEFDPPAPQPSRFEVIFHNYSPPGHLLTPRAFEVALSMVAGFLIHARGSGISVELSAKVNDWVPLRIDPRHGMEEALEVLACARYRPERSADKLVEAVSWIPSGSGSRTFVLSDTPVQFWENLLPPVSRPIICLDTKGTFRKVFKFPKAGEKAGGERLKTGEAGAALAGSD